MQIPHLLWFLDILYELGDWTFVVMWVVNIFSSDIYLLTPVWYVSFHSQCNQLFLSWFLLYNWWFKKTPTFWKEFAFTSDNIMLSFLCLNCWTFYCRIRYIWMYMNIIIKLAEFWNGTPPMWSALRWRISMLTGCLKPPRRLLILTPTSQVKHHHDFRKQILRFLTESLPSLHLWVPRKLVFLDNSLW